MFYFRALTPFLGTATTYAAATTYATTTCIQSFCQRFTTASCTYATSKFRIVQSFSLVYKCLSIGFLMNNPQQSAVVSMSLSLQYPQLHQGTGVMWSF